MNSRTVLHSSIRTTHVSFNTGVRKGPCYIVPRRLTVRGLFLRRTRLSDVAIRPSRVATGVRTHLGRLIVHTNSGRGLRRCCRGAVARVHRVVCRSLGRRCVIRGIHTGLASSVGIAPTRIHHCFGSVPRSDLP